MPNFLKYLNLWIPFLFASFVGYEAFFSLKGGTAMPLFSQFFLWIPMAFLFLGAAAQAHISKLEKRIDSLEKLSSRTDQVSD